MSARRTMAEQVLCRALCERPLSEFAWQSLGGCSPSAWQTTCPAIARRVLVGISGVQICKLALQRVLRHHLLHSLTGFNQNNHNTLKAGMVLA